MGLKTSEHKLILKQISLFNTNLENLEDKEILNRALDVAIKHHFGQWYQWLNHQKIPYIYHILNVSNNIFNFSDKTETIITALWHDLLEDTNIKEIELEQFIVSNNLNLNILIWLKTLNRNNKTVTRYYSDIAQYHGALLVKSADLLSNLNASLIRLDEMLLDQTRYWFYEYIIEVNSFILQQNVPFEMKHQLKTISHKILERLDPLYKDEIENYKLKYLGGGKDE